MKKDMSIQMPEQFSAESQVVQPGPDAINVNTKCLLPLRVIGVQENSPIAWSSDGSRLGFVSGNGSIYIAKDSKGSFEIENVLNGHSHSVNCLLFHPKESILVSGGFDGIIIWDYIKGFIIKRIRPHVDADAHESKVECLEWLHDGITLVSGAKDSNIKVWDVLKNFQLMETITGHKAPVICFGFSPSTNILASAGRDSSVKLWDVSTLQRDWRSKREDDSSIKINLSQSFDGHRGDVISLAFNRDGSLLFSGARDNEIKVWSVQGSEEIRSIKFHRGDVTNMSLLLKDTVLLTSSIDGTLKCIKLAKQQDLAIESDVLELDDLKKDLESIETDMSKPEDLAIPLAGVPSSTSMILGTLVGHQQDDKDAIIYSHESHDGIGIGSLKVSPNGNVIATSSMDRSVRIWRLSSNISERPVLFHEFVGHKGPVNSVTLLPDSERFVSGSSDYHVFLFNMRTMKREADFNFEGSVYTLRIGTKSDQTVIFVGGNHYDIKGYCINTEGNAAFKEVVRYSGHSGKVEAMSINNDCTLLASGGFDFDLFLWQVKMPFVPRDDSIVQRPISKYNAHKGHITSISFSEDGHRLVSVSTDHSMIIWDVGSKKLSKQRTIEQAHSSVISSVTFGKGVSSNFIYTVGWDGMIKVWDISNKKNFALKEIHGHTSRITQVTVSPDGNTISTACSDGTIRTWMAIRPFNLIVEYTPNDSSCSNCISSGSTTLISASDNGMIRCWPHNLPEFSQYFLNN
eukprot:gene11229-13756_t